VKYGAITSSPSHFSHPPLTQVSASAGNECGNKIKAIQAAFARTIAASKSGLSTSLAKLSCDKDMARNDFYYMIADAWSMGIQYGGKTHMCEAFSTITDKSTDDEIENVFAAWSNDYWGTDFCAGGFCKCFFFFICVP